MARYEVSFKLQHECPYNDITRKYPGVVFIVWCNSNKHVVELSNKDFRSFPTIYRDLQNLSKGSGKGIVRKSFTSSSVQMVLHNCRCYTDGISIVPQIERHNCLQLGPNLYKEGWEWYTIVAFSQKDIQLFFRELEKSCHDVKLTSRKVVKEGSLKDAFLISTATLFGGLSEKQLGALFLAINHGYYTIPKKIKAVDIASSLGLPRTTFEEHLRKAESKILSSIAPFIQMSGTWNQRVASFRKFQNNDSLNEDQALSQESLLSPRQYN